MGGTIDYALDGGVAVIRLNDPATLNALTPSLIDTLQDAALQAARQARAMVLFGAGRGFCSGFNLASVPGGTDGTPHDAGRTLEQNVNPLMLTLRDMPIPWISAVHGAAAGVGASLALAADMIVTGESAYFLQAFRKIGLVPDGGATWLLSRAVGRVRAMEMMLLGEKLPAPRALDWGLINRVVPDDQVHATALKLAKEMAAGPTKTLGLIRRTAWEAEATDFSQALTTERRVQREAGYTDDHAEGVRAFFEKRDARFTGA